MKTNKILAALSAAALAASCFALTATAAVTEPACPEFADLHYDQEGNFNGGTLHIKLDFGKKDAEGSSTSATKLTDIVYPIDKEETEMTEEEKATNKAYYSIGAMGFFMNQSWTWNQGDWVGIDADGIIDVEYSINKVLADPSLDGKGTLGSMGIMVCNLPADNYPYEVSVLEATFTPDGGDTIELESVKAITEATEHAEGNFRIVLRAADATDDPVDDSSSESDSSSVSDSSSSTADSSSAANSSSSKSDSSSSKSTTTTTSTAKSTTTTTTTTTTGSSASTAASDSTASSDTGVGGGVALAVCAVAASAIVVCRKKH